MGILLAMIGVLIIAAIADIADRRLFKRLTKMHDEFRGKPYRSKDRK